MLYALMGIAAAFCAFIQWGDEIPVPNISNLNQKEAKYTYKVQKQEEKEKYKRQKYTKNPSGYMTVEEYELLSTPKDPMSIEIQAPKIATPADMVYVPQPSYKIVRYNNPPGSPELTITKTFYQRRQQNLQGIVSPDFKKLVYPSIYYYPNSGSTACDLFVINLELAKSNLDRILSANVIHKVSEPILSTEKNNDNYYTFRTLTPVDFNIDGSMLLVKEKTGNTKDGIWKTTPIVCNFSTKTSYELVEVRDAIVYYWKEINNIDLDEKRWDVYPLGFDQENPDWIIVKAYAYTGSVPVNLGVWRVRWDGEQSKLVTFKETDILISSNGYKIVKDGVKSPSISEKEEKQLKRIEKDNLKEKKKHEKTEDKALEQSYKAKLKEMNKEYNEQQKDYKLRQRIQGSTSGNEAVEKYNEIKVKQELKHQQKLEKLHQKELKQLEKK